MMRKRISKSWFESGKSRLKMYKGALDIFQCERVMFPMNENNNHWASNLYPNPAGDLTNLHVVGNSQGEFLLSISNSLGQMFMQQTIILEAGEQNILLNTSTMAEGIYQVVLRDRTEIKTSKKLLIIK